MANTRDKIAVALLKEALDFSTARLGTSHTPYKQFQLSGHDRMTLRTMMSDDIHRAQAWLLKLISGWDDAEISDDNGLLTSVPFEVDADGDDDYPFCGHLVQVDAEIWAIVEYVYEHEIEPGEPKTIWVRHPSTRLFLFGSEGAARTAFVGFRMANTAWRLSNLEEFEVENGEDAA